MSPDRLILPDLYVSCSLADDPRFSNFTFENMNSNELGILLAAQAAHNIGRHGRVMSYLKAALQIHKHPIRQFYAHTRLGAASMEGKDKKQKKQV